MALPRPASPRALWNDIRALLRERPRHQWIAAALAIVIPLGLVFAFFLDSRTNLTPRRTIYHVNVWPADRSDEEIKAKQQADLARKRAEQAERQREFQQLDQQLNRLGI